MDTYHIDETMYQVIRKGNLCQLENETRTLRYFESGGISLILSVPVRQTNHYVTTHRHPDQITIESNERSVSFQTLSYESLLYAQRLCQLKDTP